MDCLQLNTIFFDRGKGRSTSQNSAPKSKGSNPPTPTPLSAKEEALLKSLAKRKRDLNQKIRLEEDVGKLKYYFIEIIDTFHVIQPFRKKLKL